MKIQSSLQRDLQALLITAASILALASAHAAETPQLAINDKVQTPLA